MQVNQRNISAIHEKGSSKGESPRQPKSTCYYRCLLWPNNISFLDCFKDNKIEVACVPANMTYLLQPLDLTVNGYAKKFTSGKFSEWYSSQIMKQLDDGKELHDINNDLKLSKLRPLHAEWLVELYNQMSTAEGQKIIHSAWKASGITEA